MDLTLPGLTNVPIGGLTAVSVLPTHRRRGILLSMIAYHFDECEGRGEPVSGLGRPSVIYGRLATAWPPPSPTTRSTQARAVPAPPAGRGLRLLEPEETAKIVPPLYDRYRPAGRTIVPAGGLVGRLRPRPQSARQGRAATTTWSRSAPAGDGWVATGSEPLANGLPPTSSRCGCWSASPEAEAALWRYLLDMDLAGTVKRPTGRSTTRSAGGWPSPAGCAHRRAATSSGCACSTSRRARGPALAVAGDLVLEVTDALLPPDEGCYRMDGADDVASASTVSTPTSPSTSPTSAPPTSAAPASPTSRRRTGHRDQPRRPPAGRPHVRGLARRPSAPRTSSRVVPSGGRPPQAGGARQPAPGPGPSIAARSGHGPGGCSTRACCCSLVLVAVRAAAACWRGCWTARRSGLGRRCLSPSASRRCPSWSSGWCSERRDRGLGPARVAGRTRPQPPLVAVPPARLAGVPIPGCECGAVPVAGVGC